MEWDGINILGTSITVFNYFIFIPLILYGLYAFHQHKENDLIIYRNPLAVTLMNGIVIFGLLIERMYILVAAVFGIAVVPAWSLHFLFALTWHGLMYLLVAKIYYLYFLQQYNLALAGIWKENINSWYIEHKTSFGDMTYLMKIILFPYFFFAFMDAIIPSMLDKTPNVYGDMWEADLIHLVEVLIPILFGSVILFKLRLVNDIYQIRNEVFVAMSMICVSFVVYMVVFSVRYVDGSRTDSVTWNRASALVNIFIMDLVAFPCSILTTLYPVYLIKKSKMEKQNQEQLIMQYAENRVGSDLRTMAKILSEYPSFAAFMSYLVYEFCPENLLFLTELVQCKIAYQKRMNYSVQILVESENKEKKIFLVDFNKNPMDLEVGFSCEKGRNFTYIFHESGSIMTKLCLSPIIPTPVMIEKYSDSLYWQMATLYEKYVKDGSQFQLNISGSARIKLSKIFDNEHREIDLFNGRPRLIPIPLDEVYRGDMMYNVMDGAVIEVLQLLQFSFSRFVSTEAFHRINVDNKFEIENNFALFAEDSGSNNIETIECPSQLTDEAFAKRLNAAESGILIKL